MHYYYCVDIGNSSSSNNKERERERERVNIHFLYLYIHRECVFIYAFAIHQRLANVCLFMHFRAPYHSSTPRQHYLEYHRTSQLQMMAAGWHCYYLCCCY